MVTKPLDLFSEASNHAIVRMPGRRFPGCVIQGDTLSSLVRLAGVIVQEARGSGNPSLMEAAEDLYDDLRGRLDHYEGVLKEHSMDLPYGSGDP